MLQHGNGANITDQIPEIIFPHALFLQKGKRGTNPPSPYKTVVHPKKDANGNMTGYTFDFFNPGLASSSEVVYTFDNPAQQLADVRVPLRKEVTSQKDGKVSYGFITLDAKDARGPLSRPEYKEILGKAGISEDTFRDFLVAARPTASKSQSQLTASDYIKLRYSKINANVTFGKGSSSIARC